jgi:adenine-specific DNA-methyltransferase
VAEPEGRLELTWANKHLRLLAHENGEYEWVDRADYRVAEVRLLHDHPSVGTTGKTRSRDNLLIRGDALHALRSLAELPEFASSVVGKVACCYIDPPFNTGQAFPQYDDGLDHSIWLTMMRDRLAQIRRLLAPSGTVWVHLDDVEVHRARCVLDEVFGAQNFLATVVWEKTTSGRNDAHFFSTDQDYILVYAKDREALRLYRLSRDLASDKAYRNPDNDPRGPWREGDYKGPKTAQERPNLYYPIVNPHNGEERWPRRDRVWAYGPEEHARHVRENLLWWGKKGTYAFPKLKKFLSTADDTSVARTLWTEAEVDTSRRAKEEIKALFPDVVPFATPKPERLLARILAIATKPGDLVLDCFAGSGTTAAVAQKMDRRWIASEWSDDTLATFMLPRLSRVVDGSDPGGVTEAAAWEGGGGFRVLDVAPSMYMGLDGLVFLAEWATNGALSETTAAQLGFSFEPDERPFCGRRGRRRLAVVDGLVDANAVRLLLGELGAGEQLVVAGTSIDPAARAELPKGSSLRKIPDALLQTYQRESRLGDLVGYRAVTNAGSP